MPTVAMIGQVCKRNEEGIRNGCDCRILNRCSDWNCNEKQIIDIHVPRQSRFICKNLGNRNHGRVVTLLFTMYDGADENFTAAKSSPEPGVARPTTTRQS